MNIRLYPRIRFMLKVSKDKGWGDWEEVSIPYLKEHFLHYWRYLNFKETDSYLECSELDEWFRGRYLPCYDHSIEIEGKFRSGFNKKGELTYV